MLLEPAQRLTQGLLALRDRRERPLMRGSLPLQRPQTTSRRIDSIGKRLRLVSLGLLIDDHGTVRGLLDRSLWHASACRPAGWVPGDCFKATVA